MNSYHEINTLKHIKYLYLRCGVNKPKLDKKSHWIFVKIIPRI